MGGQRAILLSLLGLLHFVATPLPVLGANVISRSDNACAEKDKAGHTLSQGSADSLPGNVSVYSCVYTEGINCQYFLSDGTPYGTVDPTCPWTLLSIAAPAPYNILRCAMKNPSGDAVSYTNPSVMYNGWTVYACAYTGGATQCKYLLSGSLMDDSGALAGACPKKLVSYSKPVSSSSDGGGDESFSTSTSYSLPTPSAQSTSQLTSVAASSLNSVTTSTQSLVTQKAAVTGTRTALPGDIIGLLVAGVVVLLGTACLVVWWYARIRRRRAARLAAESPFDLFVAAHPAPPVTARGSAKGLAAARRDALSPVESAETPIAPALGADAYVGMLAAEMRRVQAEYGSNAPPVYAAAAGVDVGANASAAPTRAEAKETVPTLPQRLTGATRKTRARWVAARK